MWLDHQKIGWCKHQGCDLIAFFFAKTLILITPGNYKLFQQEPCCSIKVVAIANSGA